MQGEQTSPRPGRPAFRSRSRTARPCAPTAQGASRGRQLLNGGNQALKGIDLSIPEHQVTALIGPSGCGKSTFLLASTGCTICSPRPATRARSCCGPDDINLVGAGVDPIEVRMRIGMVFQKPNPFPKTVFENVAYGLRLRGVRNGPTSRNGSKAQRAAAIWDEVKDRLSDSAARALRRPDAAPLHRPRTRDAAGDTAVRRADVGARPDRNREDRGTHLELRQHVTILIVVTMQQAARVSDFTFMYLGELVEVGATSMIFTNPGKKATEDYITGRYG